MAPDDTPVTIEEATSSSPEILAALGSLVGQLSSSAPAPSATEIEALVASDATALLIAREREGLIVGMLTLAVFRVPTGVRAWIEDVVVDREARGRGIGALLTLEALRRAADAGARTVELTSRPSREEANRLYAKLGFRLRETNVYRYEERSSA
jgi:ribosomal protein S18 acetylase RimI-like enzyme